LNALHVPSATCIELRTCNRSDAGRQHSAGRRAPPYRQAYVMGLEGIASKRLTAPYRSGPSREVKNPDSPAMVRHRE
jgi:hypothetical protein